MTHASHTVYNAVSAQVDANFAIASMIQKQCLDLHYRDTDVFLKDVGGTFDKLDLLQSAMETINANLDLFFGPYTALNEPHLFEAVAKSTDAINRCRAAFIVNEDEPVMIEHRATMLYTLPYVHKALIEHAERLKEMLVINMERGTIDARSASKVVFDFYLESIIAKIKKYDHVFMFDAWWLIDNHEISDTYRGLIKLYLRRGPVTKVVSSEHSLPLFYMAEFER